MPLYIVKRAVEQTSQQCCLGDLSYLG